MGVLENPVVCETKVEAMHCNTYHLNLDDNTDHQVIAQCMKGGGMDCGRGFHCEYGAQPSLDELIDLPPNSELAKNGDADADAGLNSGSAKELGEGNPTDGVAMDQGLDLESGSERELETESNANAGTGSFSLSSKGFFVKALNSFFIHSLKLFGIKTVESAWLEDLCKPGADPLRSGFVACSQKSDCNNREQSPIRNRDGNGNGNDNGNPHFKLSGKKPPRPPRPPRPPNASADPSKDKVIKYMLRRAKSERMISLKAKQMAKSKSSNSSSVWALVCTLCFCVIMILQGIFSQGSGGAQISPEASSQTNSFFVQKYDNGEPWHVIGPDQHSVSSDRFGPTPGKARSIQSDRKS